MSILQRKIEFVKRNFLVNSLNKRNQELSDLLESINSSKDKLIKEKEKIIKHLLDQLERSAATVKFICLRRIRI